MVFDGSEGFGTDHVLDPAGIIFGSLRIHTEGNQHPGQDTMAFVNGLGNLKSGLGESDITVFVNVDKSVVAQIADIDADTGLGEVQLIDNIDRTDRSDPFGQDQYGLQIIFSGFLYFQGITSCTA